MPTADPSHITIVTWFIFGAQFAGLLAAWATRCSEGSRHQTLCQGTFLAALALVGLAAVLALGLNPGAWLACGTTLCTMVVAATWEFTRPTPQST